MPDDQVKVVAWETTRRCALRCRHCRGAARATEYVGELTTAEGLRLIDAIADYAKPVLILTGGEPMSRADIYDLARHAADRGLRVAMAPCGPLLTPETARRLIAAGVRRISVSIDGADAATHDAFRGVAGAFEAALRGLRGAREAGLEFQVNTTVSRHTADQLPAILDLAANLGAAALDLFFLVPTGRGAALKDLELPAPDCERTLQWVADAARQAPISIKTTCAPHYARFAAPPAAAPGRPAGRAASGCMAGRGFVFVSHQGILQPCGFLDMACGDLRAADFNFGCLYETAPVFRALRDVDAYHGKCGVCEYRRTCGGCRARAYAMSGDYLAQEPACAYTPRQGRTPAS